MRCFNVKLSQQFKLFKISDIKTDNCYGQIVIKKYTFLILVFNLICTFEKLRKTN